MTKKTRQYYKKTKKKLLYVGGAKKPRPALGPKVKGLVGVHEEKIQAQSTGSRPKSGLFSSMRMSTFKQEQAAKAAQPAASQQKKGPPTILNRIYSSVIGSLHTLSPNQLGQRYTKYKSSHSSSQPKVKIKQPQEQSLNMNSGIGKMDAQAAIAAALGEPSQNRKEPSPVLGGKSTGLGGLGGQPALGIKTVRLGGPSGASGASIGASGASIGAVATPTKLSTLTAATPATGASIVAAAGSPTKSLPLAAAATQAVAASTPPAVAAEAAVTKTPAVSTPPKSLTADIAVQGTKTPEGAGAQTSAVTMPKSPRLKIPASSPALETSPAQSPAPSPASLPTPAPAQAPAPAPRRSLKRSLGGTQLARTESTTGAPSESSPELKEQQPAKLIIPPPPTNAGTPLGNKIREATTALINAKKEVAPPFPTLPNIATEPASKITIGNITPKEPGIVTFGNKKGNTNSRSFVQRAKNNIYSGQFKVGNTNVVRGVNGTVFRSKKDIAVGKLAIPSIFGNSIKKTNKKANPVASAAAPTQPTPQTSQ